MHIALNIKVRKRINGWSSFLFIFTFAFFMGGVVGKSQTLNFKDLPIYSIYYSTEKKVLMGTGSLIGISTNPLSRTSFLLTNAHLMYRGLEALAKGDPHLNFKLMKISKDKSNVKKRKIGIPFKIKKIIDLSLMSNLALFEIETQSELNNHLPLREKKLSPNEDLFVMGSINGKPIELKKVGPIHQYPNYAKQSFFVEEIAIYGLKNFFGISGSPVLDKDGKVAGVITGGIRNLLLFTPIGQLTTNNFYSLNIKDVLLREAQFTHHQIRQGDSEAQYAIGEYSYQSLASGASEHDRWPVIKEEVLNDLIQGVETGGFRGQGSTINNYLYDSELSIKEKVLGLLIQAAKQGHYFAMKLLLTSSYVTSESIHLIASNPGQKLTDVLGVWILNSNLYSSFGWKFKIYQLHKAAHLGSGKAMVALMETYWKGLLSVEKDLDKAIEWALKAVNQNYISILDSLEENIKRGDSSALVILKTITEKTHKKWLRLKLSEVHFLKGEISEGLRLLKELAEGNDPQAQFELASRYLEGNGVEKNLTKALKLIKLSSASGYSEAQFKLAEMYYKGIHIKKDFDKANRLLGQIILNQVPLATDASILGSLIWDLDDFIFRVFLNLGNIGIEKKSYEKADQYFTIVRLYGPDQFKSEAILRLIGIYSNSLEFFMEKQKEKIDEWNRIKQDSPNHLKLEGLKSDIQLLKRSIEILEEAIPQLEEESKLINKKLKWNPCAQVLSVHKTVQ